mmetsp:Transcript_17701/g.30473  ORF Transcript_17701/g.30473 Transcript_17701/m.30473 type:complete len:304 (+) Transcript_17701:70-981(+)|eukprot:CAMPEP_0196660258 /NCGR_PEP_ID=MMETSP1086-20130531/38847_1 /TAXON_ID=77921 /ORGANISM="Cyanoptyche  gloeocystis , Strain SAG4.97" /LENGTH=303 /DNA_ID=CAMNT_0041994581 /DNA_START=61 /DNA_END=972 /DNA_ORIENTATION=+
MGLEFELQIAEEVARKSGATIVELIENNQLNPERKHDKSFVTAADKAADVIISTVLKEKFPQDLIVSEESWPPGQEMYPESRRVWFIDPIDGTGRMVEGSSDFSVMIGLALPGPSGLLPALGLLYQPRGDICWKAVIEPSGPIVAERVERGTSFKLDPLPAINSPPAEVRVIASPAHFNSDSKEGKVVLPLLEKLRHASPACNVTAVKRGSVGLKAMAVTDAVAELFFSPLKNLALWDLCAPHVLLRAVGADLYSLDGVPIRYDGPSVAAPSGGIMASSPSTRELALNVVAPAAKELKEAGVY